MTGLDPALCAAAAPPLPRDGAGVPVTHRARHRGRVRPGSRPRHAAPGSGLRLALPVPRRRPAARRSHRHARTAGSRQHSRTGAAGARSHERTGRAGPRPRPRTAIAAAGMDLLLWIVAGEWVAACRYDFDIRRVPWLAVSSLGLQAGLAQVVVGHLNSTYRNRHPAGSFDEALMLSVSVLTVSALCSLEVFWLPVDGLPGSLPALAFPVALVLTAGMRYLRRLAGERRRQHGPDAQRVLIYGAGETGARLAQRMLRDPRSPFLPVGFVDDDRDKRNMRSSGLRVLGA